MFLPFRSVTKFFHCSELSTVLCGGQCHSKLKENRRKTDLYRLVAYVKNITRADYTTQTPIDFDWYTPHPYQHTTGFIKKYLTHPFSPPRKKPYSNQAWMHESVYNEFHIYVNVELRRKNTPALLHLNEIYI